jgi:hypothetical protein
MTRKIQLASQKPKKKKNKKWETREKINPNYHLFAQVFFIALNIRASFHEDNGGSTSIITDKERGVQEKKERRRLTIDTNITVTNTNESAERRTLNISK